ncbi:MAG: hypothetical protein R2720_12570 [Candidatus Nanopelagicales bacterium]
MSWVWIVLGALLIVLVGSLLFGFFYWRPRAQRRVTEATQAIAQEMHGRPPLLIAPAQCREVDVRDGAGLRGLGVLALTEQAVLYSGGGRVVILQRDGLRLQAKGTSLEFQSTVPPARLVVTLPDTASWQQHLAA